MKKKLLITCGVVVVILVGGYLAVTDGLAEGAKVTLDGVNVTSTPDGSYTGTYDFKRWTNTVTVNVKDQKIVSIDLDKDVVAAGITHCQDETFRRVIESQNTQVDAVSGATVTSKAYLKAVEIALKQ